MTLPTVSLEPQGAAPSESMGEPELTCLLTVGDYMEGCLGTEQKGQKENNLVPEKARPQTGYHADLQAEAMEPV